VTKTLQSTAGNRPVTMADLIAARPKVDAAGIAKVNQIACGGGLYLQITPGRVAREGGKVTFAASWVGRYTDPATGKDRWPGLGSFDENDPQALEKARAALIALKAQAKAGIDPLKVKQEAKERANDEARRRKTLEQVFEEYVIAHAKLRKDRWAENTRGSFSKWVRPVIGGVFIGDVASKDVRSVLRQRVVEDGEDLGEFIHVRTPTALKVRERIKCVLAWAAEEEQGYRSGPNPAARDSLGMSLPTHDDEEEQAALPYEDAPALMAKLVASDSPVDRAIAWIVLTGVRRGAFLHMTWGQIDLNRNLWIVPKRYTKSWPKDFHLPLSSAAVAILKKQIVHRRSSDPDAAVFPPLRGGGASIGTGTLLRRLQHDHPEFKSIDGEAITLHGMRTTFGEWCDQEGGVPEKISETALMHSVGSKVRRKYKRRDYYPQRCQLMENWACYLLTGKTKRWVNQVHLRNEEDQAELEAA
jgi:integrase